MEPPRLDTSKGKRYSYKRMNDLPSSNGVTEPSDTPERLLAAGRRLFARGGFEGTSVRSLTTEAGANLGAVTYHFGTKEAFYLAILG